MPLMGAYESGIIHKIKKNHIEVVLIVPKIRCHITRIARVITAIIKLALLEL